MPRIDYSEESVVIDIGQKQADEEELDNSLVSFFFIAKFSYSFYLFLIKIFLIIDVHAFFVDRTVATVHVHFTFSRYIQLGLVSFFVAISKITN